MAPWQISVVVRNADAEDLSILLLPVPPPPALASPYALPPDADADADGEGQQPPFDFQDSELWDLPVAPLAVSSHPGTQLLPDNLDAQTAMFKHLAEDVGKQLHAAGLPFFNCIHALKEIQLSVDPIDISRATWQFCRLLVEPDFGPGDQLHTVIFLVHTHEAEASGERVVWFRYPTVYKLLNQPEIDGKRIGHLAAVGFSLFADNLLSNYDLAISVQEFPPGTRICPLDSRTLKPFSKTNLVVIASERHPIEDGKAKDVLIVGDSLIVDPGSSSVTAKSHLTSIMRSLPKKLLVFLTHHHFDHIEGLVMVQRENPQAIILAHESTLKRASKAVKAFKCMVVFGGEKVLVAGQELEVIRAPGHTDGHLALFHRGQRTLIVGDHCVGEGSSSLDSRSGGNMQEYLDTTKQFLKLRPHLILPMHGRPNFWPIHMLKGYLRHREARESKILKAIEGGARTAFEIVSEAYKEAPVSAWPVTLHNVKLHVEHLSCLNRLPEDFSLKAFQSSSGASFFWYYIPTATTHALYRRTSPRGCKALFLGIGGSTILAIAICFVSLIWANGNNHHSKAL